MNYFFLRVACLCFLAFQGVASACPVQLSSIEIGFARAVYMQDNYIFICDYGLSIIDNTDPVNPILLSEVSMRSPENAAFNDTLVYVANLWDGLVIVDISDISNPVVLSTTELPEWRAGRVSYWEEHVYVENSGEGVQILNVANPYQPSIVNELEPESFSFRDAVVHEGFLYTVYLGDVEVFNLSDPANPVSVGDVSSPTYASAISLYDTLLCINNFFGETSLHSISDPANPIHLAEFELSRRVQGVSINQNFLAAIPDAGLELVPLAPLSEVRVASRTSFSDVRAVFLSETIALVADRDSLHILSMDCSFPPLAELQSTPEFGEVETVFSLDASKSADIESFDEELLYRWDFQSDGQFDTPWYTSSNLFHQFETTGLHTVCVEVIDTDMLSDTTMLEILVGNYPDIILGISPIFGTIDSIFTFDACLSTDVESSPESLLFRWHFDWFGYPHNAYDTLCTVTHQYSWPGSHELRLDVMDTDGFVTTESVTVVVQDEVAVDEPSNLPGGIDLSVYPNPFNPTTTVYFTLPRAEVSSLTLHDLTGRLVRTIARGVYSQGEQRVQLDASNLSSGIYLVMLQTRDAQLVSKVMLLK